MIGFLLDTNLVSELTRERPEPRIVAFLRWARDAWLSAVVIHELEFGIRLMPTGQRQAQMRADVAGIVLTFDHRILPVDRSAAEAAARLRELAIRSGRTPGVADMLIAGTAAARNLAVATRNVRDFEGLGIEVVNPWEFDLWDPS